MFTGCIDGPAPGISNSGGGCMKKNILALIIVFLFCAFLRATDVRISGLGLVNFMVKDDDTLMQIYPGQITNYQNEIEMSTVTTTGFIDYAIDSMTLGFQYLNYSGPVTSPAPNSTSILNSASPVNPAAIYAPTKSFNLIFGKKLDDTSSAALVLAYAGGADEGENSQLNPTTPSYTYDTKQGSYDFGLGLGYSLKNFLDIGLQAGVPYINNTGYDNYSFGSVAEQPYMYETMKMTYGIYGKLNARVLVLPLIIGISSGVVSEKIDDFQQKDNNNTGTFTALNDINTQYSDIYRNYSFSGGASLNLQISPSLVIIPAININYTYIMSEQITANFDNPANNTNTETDTGSWTIPAYIAAEYKINDYLTWRGGFRSYLYYLTAGRTYNYLYFPNNYYSFVTQTNFAPAMMSGLSVYIGPLAIDGGITFGSGLTSNLAAVLKF